MKKKIAMILMAAGCLAGVGVQAGASDMQVHFLDVGQGLSVLVQCDGENLIYDGGDKEASSFVVAYLKEQGVDQIDYMVSSHYDSDHLAGLVGCLNAFSVENVIGSDYVHDSKLYKSFMDSVNKNGLTMQYPDAGDTFTLGSAQVEILGPESTSSDSNNNSVVVKITNGEDRFVIPGDAESDEESSMIASGEDLGCDVLVLGHHGSATSTSWDWLAAATPEYAVISCGQDNQYGHPHIETLEKMQAMDIEIFRTDEQGTVVAESSGNGITWSTNPSDSYTSGDGETVDGMDSEEETETVEEVTQADPGDGELVWLSATGEKYHSINNCGRMNPDKARQVSRSEAEAEGYGACEKCW